MKYLFSIVLFFSIGLVAQAQPLSGNAVLDSLINALGNPSNSKDDSNRVKLINRIGFLYYEYDPNIGIEYGNKGQKLAEKIGWTSGVANAYNVIGVNNQVLGNNDVALNCFQKALRLNESIKNELAAAMNIGNIAVLYYTESNYPRSLEYLYRALKIFERTGNYLGIANQYCNIGNIYEEQKDFEKALHYDSLSLAYFRKIHDERGEATMLGNIANALSGLGLHTRSLEFNKEALALYKAMQNPEGLGRSYMNLATNYLALSDNGSALSSLYAAKEVLSKTHNIRGLGLLYTNLAETYYKMAMAANGTPHGIGLSGKQRNLQLATENALKGIEIGKGQNFQTTIVACYGTLAMAQKEMGRYKESLDNFMTYTSLKDSLYSTENKKKLQNIENQHQIEQKENRIKILEQNNKLKDLSVAKKSLTNRVLGIGIILLLVVVFTSVMYFVRRQRTEKAIANEKINTLLKEQELKSVNDMLEGQEQERKRIAADLHDRLGSMLSTIKLYFASVEDEVKVESEQYEKATMLLDNACEEVRRISHNLVAGELAKFGLVSALEQLQETILRTGKLNVQVFAYGMEERLATAAEIGLYRVIQELMNNIIRHAKASKVVIQLNRVDDNLNIVVEDDGIGFDVDEAIKKNGIGLKNIDARVKKLNGHVAFDSGKGRGTTTVIDVPVRDVSFTENQTI